MEEAIEKVRSKEMSIRNAIMEYQVPYGTLFRRLKAPISENVSLGPEGD